jgi:serine/threonine-protein kinase
VREQVTARLRQGLLPMLGASTSASAPATRPTNAEAYELYMRATALSTDQEPNRQAIQLLERAVKLDPNFAPAWTALARCYTFEAAYGNDPDANYRRGEAAVARAMALDPDLEEAKSISISHHVERGGWNAAYDDASELVRKRPGSGRAHFTLAYVLRYGGLYDESMSECETALLLDPRERRLRSCADPFELVGKYDRAMDFARLDAGTDYAAGAMADILLRQGKHKEAIELSKRFSTPATMACYENRPKAQIEKLWAGEASGLDNFPDPEPKYFTAAIFATCDMHPEALRLLRAAVRGGYCSFPAVDTDPLWASLRNTPEFADIRKEAMACRDRARAHMQSRK